MDGQPSDRQELMSERFSANLLAAREKAGLTQAQLAERFAIHRSEVSLLERGGRMPGLGMLFKLAAGLGAPPAELCAGVVWDIERQRFE